MDISLSIASFPVDSETMEDMQKLLEMAERDYSKTLFQYSWQQADAKGFAVLAYTDGNELLGFAAALDIIGLDSYEWSAFVHPGYRRLTIGSALAGGITYGLEQRGAEEQLGAFIEDDAAKKFMESLGYRPEFQEIELAAEPLADFAFPDSLTVTPYNGELEALENMMAAAFDEEVIPVIHYNIEREDRDVFVLKQEEILVGSVTLLREEGDLWITALAVAPAVQGRGYGKALLSWCRTYAGQQGMNKVILEVETENDAVEVYKKAGFIPVRSVEYWKKPEVNKI